MGSEEKGHSEGDVIAEKFRVVRRLGVGGMGEVYEAEHMLTHKRVALKIMLLGRVADGDSAKERFMREARAACAIRHPAIVPVHDVLFMGERLVIVMDLLKGKDLFAILDRRRIHFIEAIEHVLPIASALGELHAAGFIHRDIKPENIFVADSGSFLLDLGIVKDTRANARITSNDPIGTPMYMSPEQAFGQPVDHRADIWSLGLVLYEALSGVAPTEADAMGKIFELIRTANFPSIRERAPEVPEELDAFVRQMLDRHASRRPAGMHVVYDTLARYASSTIVSRYPRPGPPPDVDDDFRHRVTTPSDAGVEARSAPQRPVLRLSGSLPGATGPQRAPTGSPVTTPAPHATPKPKASGFAVAMIALLGLSLVGAVAYLGFTFVREGARQPETATVATDPTTTAPAATDPQNSLLREGPMIAPSSMASLWPEESAPSEPAASASALASASAEPSASAVAGSRGRPPTVRPSTAKTAALAAPPTTAPPPIMAPPPTTAPPPATTPKPTPSIKLPFP